MKRQGAVVAFCLLLISVFPAYKVEAALTYMRTPSGSEVESPVTLQLRSDDIFTAGEDACGTNGSETLETFTLGLEEVGFTGVIYVPAGILNTASSPSSFGVDPNDSGTWTDAGAYMYHDFQIEAPAGFEPYAAQAYCYWSSSGWMYGSQYEYNDDNAVFTFVEGEEPPAENATSTDAQMIATSITFGFGTLIYVSALVGTFIFVLKR